MTKTQVIQQAREMGMQDDVVQALERDFAQFPEELSEQDMEAVEGILAEAERAELLAEASINEMADDLERAADRILEASDNYVDAVAEETLRTVELANNLIGDE